MPLLGLLTAILAAAFFVHHIHQSSEAIFELHVEAL